MGDGKRLCRYPLAKVTGVIPWERPALLEYCLVGTSVSLKAIFGVAK